MGFALFAASLFALAMFSTTPESRREAVQGDKMPRLRKVSNGAGLFSLVLLASFFF